MSPALARPLSASTPAGTSAETVDVARVYPLLRRSVERIVRTEIDAPDELIEDACQIAWSRLLRHADRVEPQAVLVWLTHTASRQARRQLRRELRDVSWEELLEERPDAEVIVLHPSPNLVEQVEHRVSIDAVSRLSDRQSRIVWLHAAGLSYAEIGAITGDSVRTVERQLSRGRTRLRQQMAA